MNKLRSVSSRKPAYNPFGTTDMAYKFQGRTTHHQIDGISASSQEHEPPECKRKNPLLRPDGKPSATNRAPRMTLYQLGYE